MPESMEEKNNFEAVIEHLTKYFEARWNLFVLNVSDKGSDIISSAVSFLVIGLFGIFFLVFISVSAAYSIGTSIGNVSQGFLYVALFYLLLCILFIIFRNTFIKIPLVNKLLSAF